MFDLNVFFYKKKIESEEDVNNNNNNNNNNDNSQSNTLDFDLKFVNLNFSQGNTVDSIHLVCLLYVTISRKFTSQSNIDFVF